MPAISTTVTTAAQGAKQIGMSDHSTQTDHFLQGPSAELHSILMGPSTEVYNVRVDPSTEPDNVPCNFMYHATLCTLNPKPLNPLNPIKP